MVFKHSWLIAVLCILILAATSWPSVAGYEDNPFLIRINIPARRLDLIMNGVLLKEYPIAVGKPTTPSKIGYFEIINKVVDPTWYPDGRRPVEPGPDNPVGTRWLGLSAPGYGIHGTNQPSSIGKAVSGGCFRMYNWHIEELYSVVPKGTPVILTYEPVEVFREPNSLAPVVIRVNPDIYNQKPLNLEDLRQLITWAGYTKPVSFANLKWLLADDSGQPYTFPRNYSAELNGIVFDHSLSLEAGRFRIDAMALTRLLGVERTGEDVLAFLLEHGWHLRPEVAAELFDLGVSLNLEAGRIEFRAPVLEYPDGKREFARVNSDGEVEAKTVPFSLVYSQDDLPFYRIAVVIDGKILEAAGYLISGITWLDLSRVSPGQIRLDYEYDADRGVLSINHQKVDNFISIAGRPLVPVTTVQDILDPTYEERLNQSILSQ